MERALAGSLWPKCRRKRGATPGTAWGRHGHECVEGVRRRSNRSTLSRFRRRYHSPDLQSGSESGVCESGQDRIQGLAELRCQALIVARASCRLSPGSLALAGGGGRRHPNRRDSGATIRSALPLWSPRTRWLRSGFTWREEAQRMPALAAGIVTHPGRPPALAPVPIQPVRVAADARGYSPSRPPPAPV